MKKVAIVSFPTPQQPSHVSTIVSLKPGASILHYHDPEVFSTRFHPWFTQLKKRHGLMHFRTSRFQFDKGVFLDGKDGREKRANPKGFYTIFNPGC